MGTRDIDGIGTRDIAYLDAQGSPVERTTRYRHDLTERLTRETSVWRTLLWREGICSNVEVMFLYLLG